MKKRDEIADPNSCLNRAADDEPVFVLRARDMQATDLVMQWAMDRARLIAAGVKPATDQAIVNDAIALAGEMQQWRAQNVPAAVAEVK